MSVVEDVKVLRKRLGIKRLRKIIPISEFEKAVIIGLREKGENRLIHKAKQYA